MGGEWRDGAAGDGSVTRARDKTIKWRVDGVVPRTGRSAHDDCTEHQDHVHLEKKGGRASEVSGGVEGPVQMWQIEVPETIRPVEAHEFDQGKPRGRNVRHPATLRRSIWHGP